MFDPAVPACVPALPGPVALPPGILSEEVWALPDDARNCFGLSNGLGAVKEVVYTNDVQEASLRRE